MQLFMQPTDVWLFRDGRPFDALSDHRAESLFPPYPTVMQGVLRSHHLAVKGIDLRDKKMIAATVGTTYDYRDLRLRGPIVARREPEGQIKRYFPVPADIVPLENGQIRSIKPRVVPVGVVTNNPTPCFSCPMKSLAKGEFGLWLDEQTLDQCLRTHSAPSFGQRSIL